MTQLSFEGRRLSDLILQLDATASDCRLKIADLREQMDAACDRKALTLSEWRELVDAISRVRSLCKGANDTHGNNGTTRAALRV